MVDRTGRADRASRTDKTESAVNIERTENKISTDRTNQTDSTDRIWSGLDYLKRIRTSEIACKIMSLLIENSVLEESLLFEMFEPAKAEQEVRKLVEAGYLEMQERKGCRIIQLSADCYEPSHRSILGQTPGRRSHRFPENWIRETIEKDSSLLDDGLLRGRFLHEWRNGQFEELKAYPPTTSKVLYCRQDGKLTILKIIPTKSASPSWDLWMVFLPSEEKRTEAWTLEFNAWIHQISSEPRVLTVQAEKHHARVQYLCG